MKALNRIAKLFRSIIFAEYLPMFFVVSAIFAVVLVITNKDGGKIATSQKTTRSSPSSELIPATASSSENDNSGRYNTWDAETASSVYFESYEAMEEYYRELEAEDRAEYDKVIKGTIVEQVQNIAIPSYVDDQSAQLQQGEILIKEPASDEFPQGISLWAASLEKSINSFTVGDFNKDGLDDVAHIIGYTGFGSGYFYHLIVFINDHGKLKYLTQEYLGDRIVIRDVKYESGSFTIDMITQGEGEDFMGYCCPNVSATIKFRLENGQLAEV